MNKSAALLIALALCSASALAAPAAKPPCSTAQLKGGYAMLLSGATRAGVYCASIGMLRFDGKGRLTSRGTLNCGSGAVEITNTGTYSVAADCTGTVTMNESATLGEVVGVAPSGETDYAISIGDAGKSVFLAITTSGATTSGSAVRQ